MINQSAYASVDYRTQGPTAVALTTVTVTIDPDVMITDYARQFYEERFRVDALLAERQEKAKGVDHLCWEDIDKYALYLIKQRVLCVENQCRDFRLLKSLYIPSFLQYGLSLIGEVIIRDQGLRLIPEFTMPEGKEIDFKEASRISGLIRMFEGKLQMVLDGMPRTRLGDVDTMSCALIADELRAHHKVEHVANAYAAAFMGFKLKEEQAMQILYRIQYDDLEYIRSAIIRRSELY